MKELKLKPIEMKFLRRGILSYGILILTTEVAKSFIEEANANRCRILGLDGFFLFGDRIQPSLEYSTDYSKDSEDVAFQKALEFIELNKNIKDDKGNKLFFEVTVE